MKENYNNPTPYDNAFRTLITKSSKLVISFVNEMFGTNYDTDGEVELLQNEHLITVADEGVKKRITDSIIKIVEDPDKRYHLECQVDGDQIIVRMFEYDAMIAIRFSYEDDGIITFRFPESGVLYLRNKDGRQRNMKARVIFPDEQVVEYEVKTIQSTDYTLEQILEKKLFFLLPFFMFRYEKEFDIINKDKDRSKEFGIEFKDFISRITNDQGFNHLSDRDRGTVIEMIEYVINNLARKQEKVREEVAKTMGGIVLTTRIDRWIAEGEAKERENIVLSAYKNGHSAEQISEFTSIPLDEVKRIISK